MDSVDDSKPIMPASLDRDVSILAERFLGEDVDLVKRAYRLAATGHYGQFRKSGDLYITHPVAVATQVADLGLDASTVAAALCHDLIEDCGVTKEDLARELGQDVAELVDGVTKVDRVRFDTADAAKAATMRKLLVGVAKDVRVLCIKLCDRVHNIETITALPPDKAHRIAVETLELYAPLAHRLGMGALHRRLEDAAFRAAYPERYREIDRLLTQRAPLREITLQKFIARVCQQLDSAGISPLSVSGRTKSHWSIYQKLVTSSRLPDDIYDMVGARILMEDVQSCYGALGVVHSTWPPVHGRLKDYIAAPTVNLYQSLHTTVRNEAGRLIEVQLRTPEMHERAERGIAAHWG